MKFRTAKGSPHFYANVPNLSLSSLTIFRLAEAMLFEPLIRLNIIGRMITKPILAQMPTTADKTVVIVVVYSSEFPLHAQQKTPKMIITAEIAKKMIVKIIRALDALKALVAVLVD